MKRDTLQRRADFLSSDGELRVREGDIQTVDEWCEAIKCTRVDFNRLREIGIFRRVTGESSNRYSLRFVGVLFVGDMSLISVPKVSVAPLTSRSQVIQELDVVIHAALSYKRRRDSRELQALVTDEPFLAEGIVGELISLAEDLLSWTRQYGFHTSEIYRRSSRDGAFDWSTTIRRGLALHGPRFVVYDRPSRRRLHWQLGDLAGLQAIALLRVRSMLGLAGEILFSADAHIFAEAEHIDSTRLYENDAQLSPTIALQDFLSTANRDHEVELANLLWRIFEKTTTPHKKSGCSLGVIAFERVWEAAVAHLLDNYFDRATYSELVAPLESPLGSTRTWLIPDFFSRIHDDSVVIFDAKWHLSTAAFPSADVVKQFMYAIMLPASTNVVANVFVVPSQGDQLKVSGSINAHPEGTRLSGAQLSISLLEMPWLSLLRSYSARRDLPLDLDIASFVATMSDLSGNISGQAIKEAGSKSDGRRFSGAA